MRNSFWCVLPIEAIDGGACCSTRMNLPTWAKGGRKEQFKHLENTFDHHLQVKRKLQKWYHINTTDISTTWAGLIIHCYWLDRLCTGKLLKRTKHTGCKQGTYFCFFTALKSDSSKCVQKRESEGCQSFAKDLAQGTPRNIKGDAKCTCVTSKFTMK